MIPISHTHGNIDQQIAGGDVAVDMSGLELGPKPIQSGIGVMKSHKIVSRVTYLNRAQIVRLILMRRWYHTGYARRYRDQHCGKKHGSNHNYTRSHCNFLHPHLRRMATNLARHLAVMQPVLFQVRQPAPAGW